MGNLFLYNKYKPNRLCDFVGQNHISKIVKYFISTKNIPCNYIFYGPKGTGKTSYSRIFFKQVNCNELLHNSSNINCFCNSKELPSIDFFEIDAASNRKLSDISKLMSRRFYIPIKHSYRMFCIDEAHMLSKFSFNYLLKVIENENSNFIIILISTEFDKIPETIKSRCLCLRFNKIKPKYIYKRLKYISEKENLNIRNKYIKLISYSSDGSLRDSLVSLDMLSAFKVKNLDTDSVLSILNLPPKKILKILVNLILLGDVKKVKKITKYIVKSNYCYFDMLLEINNIITSINIRYINTNGGVNYLLSKLRNSLIRELKYFNYYNHEAINFIYITYKLSCYSFTFRKRRSFFIS
ncbi:DNA polymerase III subunit gamma/tau [Candidatus Vidania fulgoroideae]|uniref:DNA polymerase III subunit gamma/tau n=1 Tax=Candidatus Vidania fulgoroideorum TaxID=881286 RepID=A0A974X7B7_9PROT|nr:DNA polymerase III subunit gamma/tau [Candidatus Vidania fulgoroideae]